MYTATLVLVLAVSLLTANLVVLGGGLAMFGLLALRSVREEERLVEKFGAAYLAYRQRTGRFLPRYFRFDSSSAARLF
jgi:protein-S-isoprenylcysteine O-methyltransferase Ste14